MPSENFKSITAIDNAIDVLIALSKQKGKSIRELGKELNITKSTLHRTLLTLKHRGFVKQDLLTEKYSLGYQILELSIHLKAQSRLRDIAISYMEKLSDQTGDTVQLAILDEEEILILDSVEGTNALRVFSMAGERFSITYGNFGRVFLSEMSLEKIDKLIEKYPLQKYGMNSITDKKTYLEKVNEVKNAGISISEDDPIDGAVSMAVPIRGKSDEIVGSLSIASAKTPIILGDLKRFELMILKCAEEITEELKNE